MRENFNFNDILSHFKSNKLAQWLELHDYKEGYEKIENLSKELLDEEVIIQLCKILKSPHSNNENQLKEISQYVRYSKGNKIFLLRFKQDKKHKTRF